MSEWSSAYYTYSYTYFTRRFAYFIGRYCRTSTEVVRLVYPCCYFVFKTSTWRHCFDWFPSVTQSPVYCSVMLQDQISARLSEEHVFAESMWHHVCEAYHVIGVYASSHSQMKWLHLTQSHRSHINGPAHRKSASWSCANGWPSSVNTFISCRVTAAAVEQETSSGMNQTKEQIIPSSPWMTCSSDPENVFASLASLSKHSWPNSALATVCVRVCVCVCVHVFSFSSTRTTPLKPLLTNHVCQTVVAATNINYD